MEKLDLLLGVAIGIFALLAILVYGQFKQASMKKEKKKVAKKLPQVTTRDLNLGLSPEIARVTKKQVATPSKQQPKAKVAKKAIVEPKTAPTAPIATESKKPLSKAAKRRGNKQTPKTVEKEAPAPIVAIKAAPKEEKEMKAKSPKPLSRAQLKKQKQKEAEKARLLAAEEAKKAAELEEKKKKAAAAAEKKKKAAEEKKKKLEAKRVRQEAEEAKKKAAEAIAAAEKKKEDEKNAEIYRKEAERKWKEAQAIEAKRKQEEEKAWNSVVSASDRKKNVEAAEATLSSLNASLTTHEKEIERLRKLKEEKQKKQLEEQKRVELQQKRLQAILLSQAEKEKSATGPVKKKQNNATPWGVPVSKLDKDLLRLDTLLDNVKIHENKIKSLHNRLAKNNAKK